MKRFSLISIAFFLLLTLVGCGQYDAIGMTEAHSIDIYEETDQEHEHKNAGFGPFDQLSFSSVEDLLDAYRAARADGDITDLVANWGAGSPISSLADVAESVDFSALERLYLLTNIPEEFQIYRISISVRTVSFWYLHKEDLVSDDAIRDARNQQQHFQFSFTRWSPESPMDDILRQGNATKEDLIDGKYLFVKPGKLEWAPDREILFMYMPLPSSNYKRLGIDEDIVRTAEQGDFADLAAGLVKFTETEVINLLDFVDDEDFLEEDILPKNEDENQDGDGSLDENQDGDSNYDENQSMSDNDVPITPLKINVLSIETLERDESRSFDLTLNQD